ncbi:latrophilin-3, partial [Biomphalaria glabrata]
MSKIKKHLWGWPLLGCLALFSYGQVLIPWDHCQSNYYTNAKCVNHPDGYGCECGPGFHWNTHQCMSSAIDSRFEFKPGEPIRYTLLWGKGFPRLNAFTIAFWLNVSDHNHPGTILSYRKENQLNILRMISGPTIRFDIHGTQVVTDLELEPKKWFHIALTWQSSDGTWVLYRNGDPVRNGRVDTKSMLPIPSGGEFVLGQSSRQVVFNSTNALDGDLSHLNIWNHVMNSSQISYINSSCTFMYCGNAIQWVEFRAGTRGAMKMRWPSGIFTGRCFSDAQSGSSCEKFCSLLIGAQCNEETRENILWLRNAANQTVNVSCPSLSREQANNSTNGTSQNFAWRLCKLEENENHGEWQEPYIDSCISSSLMAIKEKTLSLEKQGINEIDLLKLAHELLNHTHEYTYINPIDIATVIDLLAILVKAQGIAPRTVTWLDEGRMYASASEIYPTFQQTKTFSELFINTVNNLLSPRHEVGWNATRPAGNEVDQLMQVMHNFADVISRSLDYHIKDGLILYHGASIQILRQYVEFKIETQWVYSLKNIEFPDNTVKDSDGRLAKESGFIKLTRDTISATNASAITVFFGISTFRYKSLSRLIPGFDKTRNRPNQVNSPVMALYFHIQPLSGDGNIEVSNLSPPILVSVPIHNTFNISNPRCVVLRHSSNRKPWSWYRGCQKLRYTGHSGVCACPQPGVFTIITDMFDDNWDKGDKRPKLMNFATYFGCAMSATLCLIVCGVHMYLRTSTSTAALHRNLSVSIALGQLVYMIGIDRYETPSICKIFAVLLHYFFLTNYSWVMNEAFNLYIVITYSTHNPSDLTDSGSMIRYYVLGWVIPAILVGAFVGTSDNYCALDMCWVAPDHLWLFIGPAIGIISITILVLIFTAKEHNENSYTKSDKTNKIINIHMKALWTQVILVTVCWSFAFISLKIMDNILKYLYAMFTSLQGAFFVVFYMFLHEE